MRAELHERYAGWLEERGGLVELDEIAGYHLEQAVRYRRELGQAADELAARAGDRLAAAGRRALWREDRPGGARFSSSERWTSRGPCDSTYCSRSTWPRPPSSTMLVRPR